MMTLTERVKIGAYMQKHETVYPKKDKWRRYGLMLIHHILGVTLANKLIVAVTLEGDFVVAGPAELMESVANRLAGSPVYRSCYFRALMPPSNAEVAYPSITESEIQ